MVREDEPHGVWHMAVSLRAAAEVRGGAGGGREVAGRARRSAGRALGPSRSFAWSRSRTSESSAKRSRPCCLSTASRPQPVTLAMARLSSQKAGSRRRRRETRRADVRGRAVGRSMEPMIHDGDFLVFRANPVGTRQGKIVLAQYRGPADPETGDHSRSSATHRRNARRRRVSGNTRESCSLR